VAQTKPRYGGINDIGRYRMTMPCSERELVTAIIGCAKGIRLAQTDTAGSAQEDTEVMCRRIEELCAALMAKVEQSNRKGK
jgi:hypothetical protein